MGEGRIVYWPERLQRCNGSDEQNALTLDGKVTLHSVQLIVSPGFVSYRVVSTESTGFKLGTFSLPVGLNENRRCRKTPQNCDTSTPLARWGLLTNHLGGLTRMRGGVSQLQATP